MKNKVIAIITVLLFGSTSETFGQSLKWKDILEEGTAAAEAAEPMVDQYIGPIKGMPGGRLICLGAIGVVAVGIVTVTTIKALQNENQRRHLCALQKPLSPEERKQLELCTTGANRCRMFPEKPRMGMALTRSPISDDWVGDGELSEYRGQNIMLIHNQPITSKGIVNLSEPSGPSSPGNEKNPGPNDITSDDVVAWFVTYEGEKSVNVTASKENFWAALFSGPDFKGMPIPLQFIKTGPAADVRQSLVVGEQYVFMARVGKRVNIERSRLDQDKIDLIKFEEENRLGRNEWLLTGVSEEEVPAGNQVAYRYDFLVIDPIEVISLKQAIEMIKINLPGFGDFPDLLKPHHERLKRVGPSKGEQERWDEFKRWHKSKSFQDFLEKIGPQRAAFLQQVIQATDPDHYIIAADEFLNLRDSNLNSVKYVLSLYELLWHIFQKFRK